MIFVEQAIREEIFFGFCRTYNQAQTVTCEFTETEEGLDLTEVDCGYRRCIHQGSCEVARQIRQMEEDHKKE